MLQVRYPIIVEGKYDKIRLKEIIRGDILVTGGFQIFKNREQLANIRRLAQEGPVILLTDSDRAGFRIRGYLAGAIPPDRIIQIYIPEIAGKERRKAAPSAAGTLGVEGMPEEVLRRAFEQAGVLADSSCPPAPAFTKTDLYRLGLSGAPDSAQLRRRVQRALGLPGALSANALCGILSRVTTLPELEQLIDRLRREQHSTERNV